MANCYKCGRKLKEDRHLRRRVKTGEWHRKRYSPSRVSHAQVSYGMRIVCKSCAKQIERQEWRSSLAGHASVVLALLVLLVVIWFTAH